MAFSRVSVGFMFVGLSAFVAHFFLFQVYGPKCCFRPGFLSLGIIDILGLHNSLLWGAGLCIMTIKNVFGLSKCPWEEKLPLFENHCLRWLMVFATGFKDSLTINYFKNR